MGLDRNVLPSFVTMMLLSLIFLTSFMYSSSQVSPIPSVDVVWTAYSNPSGGDDIAYATCYVNGTVLVFGSDSSPGDSQFRVEARDAGDGGLKGYKVYNPGNGNDTISDCVMLDSHVYGAGATVVTSLSLASLPKAFALKTSSSLDIFEVKDLGWMGLATTVESDGSYVYVGGSDLKGLSLVFRVDKLDKSLSKMASYKSQGLSGSHLITVSMAFNRITGHLWIIGVVNPSGDKWWVEVVDPSSMTLVKSIDPGISGYAFSALSDDNGYMYILGDKGYILKLDKDGNIIATKQLESKPSLLKGSIINSMIIAAGHEQSGGYYRHVIYLLDTDLNVLSKKILSESIGADSQMVLGKLAREGAKIYVAGADKEPGNHRWVVYALQVTGITQTVTITVTSTITTTITVTQPTTITTTITQPTTVTYTTTTTLTTTKTETITTQPTTVTLTTTYTEAKTDTITTTLTQTVTSVVMNTITLTQTVTERLAETITVTTPQERRVTFLTTTTVTGMATKEVTRTERETITMATTATIEAIPSTPIIASAVVIALAVITVFFMLLRR